MENFIPFATESDTFAIGNLTIENRLDRVTLSGDVDLTRDKAGLVMARRLQTLVANIVARLEAESLPDVLPKPSVKKVTNPFT